MTPTWTAFVTGMLLGGFVAVCVVSMVMISRDGQQGNGLDDR